MITVLSDARIFDGNSEEFRHGYVVVENDKIREVCERPPSFKNAMTIECGRRVLMPGLIDAHFHAYTPTFDLEKNDRMPPALMASHAVRILEGALQRGFTTVRDAGGGDAGLSMAIEQGLIDGPRFFYSGKSLSQTGGHGDIRPVGQGSACGCGSYSGVMSMVVDGVDDVRHAVRDQLRNGATQIKLFVSGGVVSPTDPLWMPQFTDEEIAAAVHEAATRRTYVMAHAHTDEAARRCATLGVRTIEHGSFISEATARLIVERGCYVVPTLSVLDVLRQHGQRIGIPPMGMEKIAQVGETTLRSMENCLRAGVKLGLGTDLLSHDFHPLQGGELQLRAELSTPLDVLRSATSINAEILQMQDKLGCIRPDAWADLLVLDGDPLQDLGLFRDSGRRLALIMKGGRAVKCNL